MPGEAGADEDGTVEIPDDDAADEEDPAVPLTEAPVHTPLVQEWGACTGGLQCAAGLKCNVQSQWYAQCIRSAPAAAGEVQEWGACTGGLKCAAGLVCNVQSQWYAQCIRGAPAAPAVQPAARAPSCEAPEMQKRANCKAQPTCKYDTSRGCTTDWEAVARQQEQDAGKPHHDDGAADDDDDDDDDDHEQQGPGKGWGKGKGKGKGSD